MWLWLTARGRSTKLTAEPEARRVFLSPTPGCPRAGPRLEMRERSSLRGGTEEGVGKDAKAGTIQKAESGDAEGQGDARAWVAKTLL